ncbi:MAG: hypothetical protein J6Y00_05835 [Paludibacteraceae bacterium]|nr:hypothetical protein [Paludibacteraceae bacterium]
MKRNISFYHFIISSFIVALCATSCRPQSDDLLSYGQNDVQAYYEANKSFAGEFKAFWMAMNENYGIWDVEESFGTDWDAVYRTYLPKFEELDKRQAKVTNEELLALYKQITDTLHDGHMSLQVKNLHTGLYITLTPHLDRVTRERGTRQNEESMNVTTLAKYQTTEVPATYRTLAYDAASSDDIIIEHLDSTVHRVNRAAIAYIAKVDAAGGPDEMNNVVYESVKELKASTDSMMNFFLMPRSSLLAFIAIMRPLYNQLCEKYALTSQQIGAEMVPIEDMLGEDMVKTIRFALFDGNIAYLRLGGCGLTGHFHPVYKQEPIPGSMYESYHLAVERVWHHWFDTIQTLHKSGDLGGVIIDMRNNGGGYVLDYQYLLGALLPSGGWNSHQLRVKNGIGRLDFGPITPFVVTTYEAEHEVINDRPIVVLANTNSVSMAENTTYGVKSQPNGCFIGTRTFGGLSALNPDPEAYSETYSGAFGVNGTTPIWGYIPKYVCLYPNKDGEYKPVEGYGFEPDIECPLDVNLWQTTGRDNQLEKALDYIKGK